MRPVDALLQILRDEQVTTVFGNPGTTELPFTEALVDAEDIAYVLGTQEGSVVAMADGYARATGRPAFVSLHIAAGLANGLVGLLNASRSRTPMVVMSGQQDRRHLAQNPLLTGDLVGLAKPAVKHTFDVQHAADLPGMLRRAFALAMQPPTGPVFLSVPMDLLAEDTQVELPARSELVPLGAAAGLERAAALLAGARSPAVVAGDGVGRAYAVAELTAVAEALGAVTYHQPMHDRVNFPGTHPLHGGDLVPTNAAIREALTGHDVVLIVGCQAFTPHHYTPGPPIPAGTQVVQLDCEQEQLGRNFGVDLGLVGGIRPSLAELADRLAGRIPQAAARIATAGTGAEARRAWVDAEARGRYGAAPLDPLAAVHAVVAGLPADAVVLEEAITCGVLLREVLHQDRPGSLVHTLGGGLGWGIGAAVGTMLGDPTRPLVAVLGDGCSLFGLQGLWSAARYGVPVTFVVMNNGEYRTLKNTLDSWDSRATQTGRYIGLDLGSPPMDFRKAADFFGIDSVRIQDADHLVDSVAKAADLQRPFLIDVPITGHTPGARPMPIGVPNDSTEAAR